MRRLKCVKINQRWRTSDRRRTRPPPISALRSASDAQALFTLLQQGGLEHATLYMLHATGMIISFYSQANEGPLMQVPVFLSAVVWSDLQPCWRLRAPLAGYWRADSQCHLELKSDTESLHLCDLCRNREPVALSFCVLLKCSRWVH